MKVEGATFWILLFFILYAVFAYDKDGRRSDGTIKKSIVKSMSNATLNAKKEIKNVTQNPIPNNENKKSDEENKTTPDKEEGKALTDLLEVKDGNIESKNGSKLSLSNIASAATGVYIAFKEVIKTLKIAKDLFVISKDAGYGDEMIGCGTEFSFIIDIQKYKEGDSVIKTKTNKIKVNNINENLTNDKNEDDFFNEDSEDQITGETIEGSVKIGESSRWSYVEQSVIGITETGSSSIGIPETISESAEREVHTIHGIKIKSGGYKFNRFYIDTGYNPQLTDFINIIPKICNEMADFVYRVELVNGTSLMKNKKNLIQRKLTVGRKTPIELQNAILLLGLHFDVKLITNNIDVLKYITNNIISEENSQFNLKDSINKIQNNGGYFVLHLANIGSVK